MKRNLAYQHHFQLVQDALAPHEKIWNHEVLHLNWKLAQVYPERWTEGILKLSEEEAYLFDTGKQIPTLAADLTELLHQIKHLSHFEKIGPPSVDIDKKTFVHIKEKKVHEITLLLALMRAHYPSEWPKRVIDIGGGVGHLARALAFTTEAEVTSLDGNEEFQEQGRTRFESLRKPQNSGSVHFKNHFFKSTGGDRDLYQLFADHDLSLGLHTCGDLSLAHMDCFINSMSGAMINFGCCYNKLDPNLHLHLSQFAKDRALPFNLYALSLATRGYAKLTLKDYQLKKRVKLFRYGLHFLLEEYYGIDFPHPVGECNTKIYDRSFYEYAELKIKEQNFDVKLSSKAMNDFIEQNHIKKQIDLMISCDLIRWQFGRIIEAYILLDRALYLEEKGKDVRLQEVFEETISPRNIALTAK